MEEMITLATKGYTIVDIMVIISFIVAFVRCIERLGKWCADKLKSYYNRKRGIEEKDNILKTHSEEIREINEKIDNMITVINSQYDLLVEKIDEQEKKLDNIDQAGKQRDCAILRDRILGGMRYFSQNIDSNGDVRITTGDHENMSALFNEYFECKGNGTVKQKYENEFSKWIID